MQTSYKPTDGSKAPVVVMSDDRKREAIAQLTDDVLSKLTGAFFDVCKFERWTKRDLSSISGINETAIGHILAGRRKNLTVETIAMLARAMGVRPELVLHDTRPIGNYQSPSRIEQAHSMAAKPSVQRGPGALSSAMGRTQHAFRGSDLQRDSTSALNIAYAQPELEKETQQ
jgi:hypothetical protein